MSAFFAVSFFLGVAFFAVAFFAEVVADLADVVLATRPDLVLVRTVGLSTTAGAAAACDGLADVEGERGTSTRVAHLLRGGGLLRGSLLGRSSLLLFGLLLGGSILLGSSLLRRRLLLLGLLLGRRLLLRRGRLLGSGSLLSKLGAARGTC